MWDVVGMTGFSRRPNDVDAARNFLIEIAQQPEVELPTYGQVAAVYGGIARGAGPVLNSIVRACDQAGEPDLTALVVDRQTQRPGTFKGQPVEPGSRIEIGWHEELMRIRRHDWSQSAT